MIRPAPKIDRNFMRFAAIDAALAWPPERRGRTSRLKKMPGESPHFAGSPKQFGRIEDLSVLQNGVEHFFA